MHKVGARSCLLIGSLLLAGCAAGARDWGKFNVLSEPPPAPQRTLGATPLKSAADYMKLVSWGAQWFRELTFGNERTMTDVAGLLNGVVQVPCEAPCAAGCYRQARVLPYVVRAIDDLDGISGNLLAGNGGPNGSGYTSDLIVTFPKGTRLFGDIEVPEKLHTGLDVEAGSPLPIGIVAIPASSAEQALPYLVDFSEMGVGPAPKQKSRLGLTCAVCHYSLDVDWDGHADLRSAWLGKDTAGSKFKPQDAWAVGNQDIHFGWLFSLSANPLLGFTVLSGPVGGNGGSKAARRWARWVQSNLEIAPEAVKRQVAIGMLAQPRGWADDTPDAVHNPTQFPALFTQLNHPYNVDGVLINASDRNNNVWTVALEFSGLVGFGNDRAGKSQKLLFWEKETVYRDFSAAQLAEVMLRYAPAVTSLADPVAARVALEALKADVLGYSDGVPGLLDPDSVVVMQGLPGIMPKKVFQHPANQGRRRAAKDYPGDAKYRDIMVGMVGTRVRTPKSVRQDPEFQQFLANYPELAQDPVLVDEIVTDAVSLMLNWSQPPRNPSALLRNAAPLVTQGYEVFRANGCAKCHSGPFFTDNLISDYRLIGTNAQRAVATRPLQTFVAPAYDPKTGDATGSGVFAALLGTRNVGYKTLTLRYLWGSAPYLHDGGVGIGLDPTGASEGDDLGTVLARKDKIYGLGRILALRESGVAPALRANAALSLQALLLKDERVRVLEANRRARVYPVVGTEQLLTMGDVGVEGMGHEFYIDDVVGGDKITALVAFLLALDDCPGQHTSPAKPCR